MYNCSLLNARTLSTVGLLVSEAVWRRVVGGGGTRLRRSGRRGGLVPGAAAGARGLCTASGGRGGAGRVVTCSDVVRGVCRCARRRRAARRWRRWWWRTTSACCSCTRRPTRAWRTGTAPALRYVVLLPPPDDVEGKVLQCRGVELPGAVRGALRRVPAGAGVACVPGGRRQT